MHIYQSVARVHDHYQRFPYKNDKLKLIKLLLWHYMQFETFSMHLNRINNKLGEQV